jgi:hypothetical protein
VEDLRRRRKRRSWLRPLPRRRLPPPMRRPLLRRRLLPSLNPLPSKLANTGRSNLVTHHRRQQEPTR